MKENVKNILIILTTIIFLIVIFFISLNYIDGKNNNVDENYVIVFRGEDTDNIYSTYIYKVEKSKTVTVKKKKKKIKTISYKYINTKIAKNNSDYTYSLERIIKKGKTNNIDEIRDIVNNNNANSYAEINKDKTLIKIDDYKNYLN